MRMAKFWGHEDTTTFLPVPCIVILLLHDTIVFFFLFLSYPVHNTR